MYERRNELLWRGVASQVNCHLILRPIEKPKLPHVSIVDQNDIGALLLKPGVGMPCNQAFLNKRAHTICKRLISLAQGGIKRDLTGHSTVWTIK